MSKKFLVIYDQSGDPEVRERLRPEHIAYRKGLGDELALAGPLLDKDEKPVGSVIILRATDEKAAAEMAENDPYVSAGVLTVSAIRPMRVAMMAPDKDG